MAPPATTGLTRSEAAILAWRKRARAAKPGALDPKIAARVKQILAGKKGKAAPKGKKPPDPAKAKAKAEKDKERAAAKQEREKAKAERATAATARKQERDKAKVDRAASAQQRLREATKKKKAAIQAARQKQGARDKAKLASTAAREKTKAEREKLTKQKQSDQEKAKVDREKANQAKQGDKDKAAKEKADTDQGDLLASVADNPKNLGYRQAGELERAGLVEKTKDGYQLTGKGKAKIADRQKKIDAAKAGKAMDMEIIPDETEGGFEALRDITVGALSAIKAGARHSKMDASHLDEAARHLHSAGATCPDCAPDDLEDEEASEDAEKAIKSIMDNPAWYAQHECGDIMQASGGLQTLAMLIQSELSEEDDDPADVSQLVEAARTLVKFIASELDELDGAATQAARARPIKGVEVSTLDDGEEIATISGYAVKSLGDTGLVGGYLVKFGGDGDLSPMRDIFTKKTNFGTHTKSDVWVHHRMLPGLGKKQLTNQAELGMDDEGVFVKHLLNLRDAYEAKLYGMVQAGKLGWSSGTAPHLVDRKALEGGRHEITQWTLGLDASYTPMPAGGFVVNAGAMKSLFADAGIDLLNAMYIDDSPEAVKTESARPDEVEADDGRARRLSIQQRMIRLREIANGTTG